MAVQANNPLVMFKQCGFIEQKPRARDHAIGRCPLCGKDEHFFINVTSANKTWDCKRCGRGGGYKKFLEFAVDVARTNFTGAAADRLAADRGLKVETLASAGVGWLPTGKLYTLPAWSADGKTLLNVKLFDFKSMRNTAGCLASMYGLWAIPDDVTIYKSVYLAEGEWDALTMTECLVDTGNEDAIVLGVPGAGTFRIDTLPFMAGKDVYLLYDNDLAGENGKAKAREILAAIATRTYGLAWPKDLIEGYDVRDLYNDNKADAAATLGYLKEHCELYDSTAPAAGGGTVPDGIAGAPVPVQEVYGGFKKWLYLPCTEIIDIVFGTTIGNRLPGDPLWMFIIAPPGGTKTVPIVALTNCPRIEAISSLTPHTLISGANAVGGGDPSLVLVLNEKVLTIEDFSGVTGLPSKDQQEIFSTLRYIYNGEYSKPFGNGIFRKYKSHFGILAAATPVMEQFIEEHAALGERFLRWENKLPSGLDAREKYIERSLDNAGKEVEMKNELHAIAKRVLLAEYKDVPKMPDEIRKKLIKLAQWVSVMRGTVTRDRYSHDRDITHKSFVELGTRIVKQLNKLCNGISMFRQAKAVDESVYRIATAVARSSIQSRYNDVMKVIYIKELHGTTEIQREVGLPKSTIELILGNLAMLGALQKEVDGTKALWYIKKDMKKTMDFCEVYPKTREEDLWRL